MNHKKTNIHSKDACITCQLSTIKEFNNNITQRHDSEKKKNKQKFEKLEERLDNYEEALSIYKNDELLMRVQELDKRIEDLEFRHTNTLHNVIDRLTSLEEKMQSIHQW